MLKLMSLLEAKQVGIIYHFTSMHSLFRILDTNKMKSNLGHISFSRNYRLGYNDTDVRIVFDGNKMSNKFKFQPFMHGNPFYDDDPEKLRKMYGDEREETIKKSSISGILKYVIKIDILDEIQDYKSDMEKLEYFKKKAPSSLKFNFVKNWNRK